MGGIDLDDETHALVRVAAKVAGISESEVVRRAVLAMAADDTEEPAPAPDPWAPVDLYADYEGRRIEGKYLPATRRLTVTTDPAAGQTFRTPSAAARAVVAALNPARTATQTNGWRFWRLAATHERLEALREAGASPVLARPPRGGAG